MESAIELSKNIDVGYLCKLWTNRPAREMADLLHGFYMLENSHDWEMRDELRLLKDTCWTKHDIEREEELREAA